MYWHSTLCRLQKELNSIKQPDTNQQTRILLLRTEQCGLCTPIVAHSLPLSQRLPMTAVEHQSTPYKTCQNLPDREWIPGAQEQSKQRKWWESFEVLWCAFLFVKHWQLKEEEEEELVVGEAEAPDEKEQCWGERRKRGRRRIGGGTGGEAARTAASAVNEE